MEEWKDIEGYEGLYQVSSFGRIKSLNYNNTKQEKILQLLNNKGYNSICLSKHNIRKTYKVHRLVAEAFIPNSDNKPCIDHINTDKTDNRVENLRWCTHTENMNNPFTKEKYNGSNHHLSKSVLQFSINGDFIRKWDCVMDIKRELNYNNSNIGSCCIGRKKSSNGFKWKYYDFELYLESKLFKAFGIKNKKVA